MKYIESYKIVCGGMPKRRETLKGANALADKLYSQKKHGEVQEVWVTETGPEFKTIRTF